MPDFPHDGMAALWRGAKIGFAIAFVLLLATAAVFAVPQLVGGDQSYVVMSGSMEPAISAGDVIISKSVDIQAVRVGDVITFDRGERFPTTHRVIEIEGSGSETRLVTQGDANEDADPEFIDGTQLVGSVQSIGGHLVVIPMFGHVVQFANTSGGKILLVFLPLMLLVLNEVYTRLGKAEDTKATAAAQSGDEPAEPAATAASETDRDGEIGGPDMLFTLLVLAIVVPYSGLMLVEHRAPLSAMVFAGGLVGFLLISTFELWTWVVARRSTASEPIATPDGGSEDPAEDTYQTDESGVAEPDGGESE